MHSTMPLELMDSFIFDTSEVIFLDGLKPYYCNKFSFETFDVISVLLHSVINPSSIVCVSITDPVMTLMHRDQTI